MTPGRLKGRKRVYPSWTSATKKRFYVRADKERKISLGLRQCLSGLSEPDRLLH
jgi:hypothetical protein